MAHKELRKSRVLVAAAGLLFGLVCLWLRIAWLQIPLHDQFEARAKANQSQHVKILPRRGPILDRRGTPLAHDLDIAQVALYRPQVLDVKHTAERIAHELGLDPRKLRKQIEAARGFLWIDRDVAPEVGDRISKLRLPGVRVDDETQRFYKLQGAASEILGRTNSDNVGVDGIEYQFERELGGQTGWKTMVPTGRSDLTVEFPGAERRAAKDGATLVLTIDAELQAIVEHHLARAVDSLKAVRGFAIFLDPWTGEILASACVPHLPAGQAKNWNFTDMYEPGSTFKVVVAGATLEEKLAKPTEYFTASSTGRAEVLPKVFIRDSHPREGYTFFGAIQNSSNIVCGKLGIRLGAERLYRYCTALGFGSMSGVEFPGETSGRLRPVSAWQPRSTPTIAMGQELAVTPIQLALAYAAIANGGVLMQPMLLKELRSPDGRVLRTWAPQTSHRVFSEQTTATLREMLCAVVDSGTATTARTAAIRIAGKTGTAQKYDPRTKGYGTGMYMGSFAGFAPADKPRMVGVVVIDEPHGAQYYGGLVAAPVFREVMLDLLRLPDGPFANSSAVEAMRPPAVPAVTAPDLCLLPPEKARRVLREYGLNVRFEGQGPRVLSHFPAAGQPVERGTTVVAFLAAPTDSSGRTLPDLVGMSMRQAVRELSKRAVNMRIAGKGIVVRQQPVAGTPLPISGSCRVWCADSGVPISSRVNASVASASSRTNRP